MKKRNVGFAIFIVIGIFAAIIGVWALKNNTRARLLEGLDNNTNDTIIDNNYNNDTLDNYGTNDYDTNNYDNSDAGSNNIDFSLDATNKFNIAELTSHGIPVLVSFSSSTCPTCIAMMPDLTQINKDYVGRALVKYIDLDKDPRATSGFEVAFTPTIYFYDANGNVYERRVGAMSYQQMKSYLDQLGA